MSTSLELERSVSTGWYSKSASIPRTIDRWMPVAAQNGLGLSIGAGSPCCRSSGCKCPPRAPYEDYTLVSRQLGILSLRNAL